jgi:hypothetical protein
MEYHNQSPLTSALEALENAATRIRAIETEARLALFDENDQEAYKQKMEEKTMLLLDLPEEMEETLQGIRKETRKVIQNGIEDFAMRAGRAWDLGSLFFMSALLYPDEYSEGDENDLERLISRVRKMV